MPKQRGIIKIKGSMGGITFYQRNGQDLSRETNGPDKNKIQNDPAFIRTRENNQEFSGAATIGKALRVGLVQEFDEMADTNTTGRITKLMKSMISRAPGVRGQRPFLPVDFKDMLSSFHFSERKSFDSIFMAPFNVAVNPERNEITFLIPDFNTGNFVNAPSGATHFRIINLMSVLSAYTFNTSIKKYEPTDAANNSKNGFEASAYIPLGPNVGSDITILAALDGAPVIPLTSAVVSCIGIEFYQEVSGVHYLLSSDNAMKVQAVY